MFSTARISATCCEEGNSPVTATSHAVLRQKFAEKVSEKDVYDQNGNSFSKPSLNGNVEVDGNVEADGNVEVDQVGKEKRPFPEYKDYLPKYPIMWSTRYRVAACLVTGMIFGLAMEKGRVFEPFNIRKQMLPGNVLFQRNIMMKMFFSAMTTSLVCLTVLSLIPSTRHLFKSARANYVCRFGTKGVLTSCLGGWLLGTGMAISGSCPGSVLTQIGAGVKNCEYTLLGCLAGALVYGLLERQISSLTRPDVTPARCLRLDDKLQMPYSIVAVPLALIIGAYVLTVEHLTPWKTELEQPTREGASFMAMYAWPPLISGMLVGLLQIPIVLSAEETIGGSSAYCTLVSQLFSKETLKSFSPYLLSYKYGLDNWWQVLYVGGAIVGAFLSATMSGTFGTAIEVSILSTFSGAFIMTFGSRLAGGCTSGNGLSGIGTLSIFAFYSVPAMFVGGIVTGVTLNLFGI